MSIAWLRVRLKQGVSSAEAARLIREQAAAFQALPYLWDTSPFPAKNPAADPLAGALLRRYQASSHALAERLVFEPEPADEDFSRAMPAHPLTRNHAIAAEWRADAYRSYLPQDLAGQLEQWRAYLTAMRSGRYDAYLFQLYLHEMTIRLYEHWQCLAEQAALLHGRLLRSSPSDDFLAVCEEIAALRPPLLHPAPLWLHWRDRRGGIDGGAQAISDNLHGYAQRLARLTRVFDSQVQTQWKLRRYQSLPGFAEFLSGANDTWLDLFLAWVERCCDERQGLFLSN